MRLIVPTIALVLAACGGSSDKPAQTTVNRDTLNERQRDSILAGSRIPGARGVGKAMRVADSTSAEIEQTNTVARDTSNEH